MPPTHVAPIVSAELAGLVYVEDVEPGITRRRSGRGFSYRYPDGSAVRSRTEIARIGSLAIPPAWTRVWICPDPAGHIQATGRDARGRKQYRYHPLWRAARDETKFGRMAAFGAALPGLRRTLARDMARDGLPRERVVATVVRLLERTLIRIGNDEYARSNGSYGLTTLRSRHATVRGATIRFVFRAKGGATHDIDVNDARAAAIVRRCRDLPGQALFQYIDDDGAARTVGSADVNAYLRDATQTPFTAKDFRTWGATLLAARLLRKMDPPRSARDGRAQVNAALRDVAAALRNTLAVCRASYVHPAIIDAYLDGSLPQRWARSARGRSEEAALTAFLRAAERRASRAAA